jgi:hypothetical protein
VRADVVQSVDALAGMAEQHRLAGDLDAAAQIGNRAS